MVGRATWATLGKWAGVRMKPTDEWSRAAFADVFCGRCSRPMAIQRLHYVDPAAGFSSIDYKCLSCGHEDMQPCQPENPTAPGKGTKPTVPVGEIHPLESQVPWTK